MAAPDATTLSILAAGLTTAGSAIGVLFKMVVAQFQKIESRLEDCESDREKLHEDQKNLWQAIALQAGVDVSELKKDK
jgi:hypothetical protein